MAAAVFVSAGYRSEEAVGDLESGQKVIHDEGPRFLHSRLRTDHKSYLERTDSPVAIRHATRVPQTTAIGTAINKQPKN